jgi:hypothetical protein
LPPVNSTPCPRPCTLYVSLTSILFMCSRRLYVYACRHAAAVPAFPGRHGHAPPAQANEHAEEITYRIRQRCSLLLPDFRAICHQHASKWPRPWSMVSPASLPHYYFGCKYY